MPAGLASAVALSGLVEGPEAVGVDGQHGKLVLAGGDGGSPLLAVQVGVVLQAGAAGERGRAAAAGVAPRTACLVERATGGEGGPPACGCRRPTSPTGRGAWGGPQGRGSPGASPHGCTTSGARPATRSGVRCGPAEAGPGGQTRGGPHLGDVEAGRVGDEHPADDGAQQAHRPGDPEPAGQRTSAPAWWAQGRAWRRAVPARHRSWSGTPPRASGLWVVPPDDQVHSAGDAHLLWLAA